jgi:hypothetical protein
MVQRIKEKEERKMENVTVTENSTVETAPVVASQETVTSGVSQTTEIPGGVVVSGDAAVTTEKRKRQPATPKAPKVVKFRKDATTVDLRTGQRKTNDAEAPYGRKADGTPRQAPGRRKAPAAQ